MPDTVRMVISGGDDLATALRELGDFTSKATARNRLAAGMIKASAPMVQAANALAAHDDVGGDQIQFVASKTLSGTQRKKAAKVNTSTTVKTYVGEQAGSSIGLLNEFGTVERTHKDGKSVGAVPPHPAMRPAFESTAASVIAAIVPVVRAELKAATDRAARKAARKLGK